MTPQCASCQHPAQVTDGQTDSEVELYGGTFLASSSPNSSVRKAQDSHCHVRHLREAGVAESVIARPGYEGVSMSRFRAGLLSHFC